MTATPPPEVTRYFGLHIARTGGTALADMALGVLGRGQCLLLSSFTQSAEDAEQFPQERSLLPLPLFSFGHYVHESLWGLLLNAGPLVSFVVLRDPRDRMRSAVRHLLSLGVDREEIKVHLSPYPNPTCTEVLRCLPLARLLYPDEPLHVQALKALSAFSRVELLAHLPRLASDLVAAWGVSDRANLQHINAQPESGEPQVQDTLTTDEFIAEDLKLWERLPDSRWRRDVSKLTALMRGFYADPEVALAAFRRHLDRYLIEEFSVLGTTNKQLAALRARQREIQRLIDALERKIG